VANGVSPSHSRLIIDQTPVAGPSYRANLVLTISTSFLARCQPLGPTCALISKCVRFRQVVLTVSRFELGLRPIPSFPASTSVESPLCNWDHRFYFHFCLHSEDRHIPFISTPERVPFQSAGPLTPSIDAYGSRRQRGAGKLTYRIGPCVRFTELLRYRWSFHRPYMGELNSHVQPGPFSVGQHGTASCQNAIKGEPPIHKVPDGITASGTSQSLTLPPICSSLLPPTGGTPHSFADRAAANRTSFPLVLLIIGPKGLSTGGTYWGSRLLR